MKALKSFIFVLSISFLAQSVVGQTLAEAIKLTKNEQYEAAEEVYVALIKSNPNNSEYYYYFGENIINSYVSDSATSDFSAYGSKALEYFTKGKNADPNNPLNYVGIGTTYLLNGDSANARINFNKARSFLPFVPKKSKTLTPPKQAEILGKIARAYIISSVNDTGITLPLLRRAIFIDKKSPDLLIIMGDAYLEINDGSNAMTNYKRALILDPKSAIAYIRIGYLYKRTKTYKDALTNFESAVNVDSSYAPGYRELAELYALAGRYSEALKTYDKFFKLSVNNTTAKISYAKFQFMVKNYSETIRLINEIKAIDNTNNILNRLLGYSYFEMGDFSKALVSIEEFISKAPHKKILSSDYMYYGRILIKLKQDSSGLLKLAKAYELDTNSKDLLREIAIGYNSIKKFADAAKYYEMIAKITKTPADIFNLGRALYNGQLFAKSDSVFASLLIEQPTSVQAMRYRALANVGMDTNTTFGLAKPYYEQLIVLSVQQDSVKYLREIKEAYDYLRFFYFKKYNVTKKKEDAAAAAAYCEKILAITPNDENSKLILKSLKGKY